MPVYRFFLDQPLTSDHTYLIEGDEFRHLKQVLRLSENDPLELVNGNGYLAFGKVISLKKDSALVHVNQVDFFPKKYSVIVLQAMPKPPNLDWIVEKGTELGMSELHIFKGDKSSHTLHEDKLHRLKTLSIAALKQSGRLYLPKIKMIATIKQWEDNYENAFYGNLSPDALPLYEALPKTFNQTTVYFCSGPESGLSIEEIDKLKQKNFIGASLHTNILRTETAPLAFLTLFHHYLLMQVDNPIIN